MESHGILRAQKSTNPGHDVLTELILKAIVLQVNKICLERHM